MSAFRCISILLLLTFAFAGVVYSLPSAIGPTGLIRVPSPATMDKERFETSAHWEYYEGLKGPFTKASHSRVYANANYGVTDRLEIGFMKPFDSNETIEDKDLVISAKYFLDSSPAGNFTLGVMMDTTTNAYSTAYLLYGRPHIFFGLGGNFGGASNKFNNLPILGGYDLANLEPEAIYFLAGIDFELGVTKGMVEYDGDAFNAGLRYPINEQFALDVAYTGVSDKDKFYEKYFSTQYNRTRFMLGLSAVF